MTGPNEHTLRKVVQGDQAAFAELYTFYRTPTLKFCNAILKDEEEAQNMVHELFIKIWDRRAQINPDLNFHSYLFTCLRNMTFDHLKKMEKNHLLRQQYLERMEALRDEEPEEEETRIQRLYLALASLSKKRKQILTLSVQEEKSYQEIADMMCISKNTVKNQLVKAKQFLREKMDLATFIALIILYLSGV